VFTSEEDDEGVPIVCRYLWLVLGPDRARWEQAFSTDGGDTWETIGSPSSPALPDRLVDVPVCSDPGFVHTGSWRVSPMMIKANGAELCVETFGERGDPAILLLSGIGGSMDWWDEDFCRLLAAAGRLVIRYDYRDTGQSTTCEPGKPRYTGRDLCDDAVAVLDALGIQSAHIAGVSMGGGIAQEVAIWHPERVATLTLMCTTAITPSEKELPRPESRVMSFAPEVDWDDRDSVVDFFVAAEKAFGGSIPMDEGRIRAIAGRVFDRSIDVKAGQTNHAMLDDDGEPVPPDALARITVPVLVIHGTEDPLFPLPHGEALAEAIPGARLVVVEGLGHQMPPPAAWPIIVPALVEISALA
jgi:pimeloyl-ACP methyl ester carboxylesterase